MKKIILLAIALMFISISAFAADVTLQWDAVIGATGYKIYISIDNGVTWPTVKDVGAVTTYVWIGVPDNVMVHFKSSAYKTGSETVAHWMGAWWDSRLMPLAGPTRMGAR